jgi:hypothetical protein
MLQLKHNGKVGIVENNVEQEQLEFPNLQLKVFHCPFEQQAILFHTK